MLHRITLLAFLAVVTGCVEVPDNVRAHFAQPGAAERTNYRPGNHGTARPAAEPAAKEAWMPKLDEGDAGAAGTEARAATTTTTSATTPEPQPEKEESQDGGAP